MHIDTFTEKGLIGTSIIRDNERMAHLTLSIPVFEMYTLHAYTRRLIYAEILVSGSGKRNRQQFNDAQNKIGSHISVKVDGSHVHMSLQTLDTALLKTLTLFTDMLKQPLFLKSELTRIKEHQGNMLTLAKEDARSRAYSGFMSSVTEVNDVRHPFTIDALLKEIPKVTHAELIEFHKNLWGTDWLCTTGGTVDSCTKIMKTLKNVRSGVTIAPSEKILQTSLKITKRTTTLIDIPHKQNIEFSIGNVLSISRSDADYSAFVFGMSVLALRGGFAGRLMSIVREKEGLTYMIYGGTENVTRDATGFWRIATFFNPKDALQGITSTLRELTRMQENGITKDELFRFTSILHTRYSLIEDSLIKKMGEAHTLQLSGITEKEYQGFKSQIAHLTLEHVNAVMKKHLNLSTLIISGAGPIKTIKKQLQNLP